ncbi:MAG: hypothetical protein JWP29_1555 [Rhodoferax sp.]|nr:hypothetical protein [Rhodoferax sp.]
MGYAAYKEFLGSSLVHAVHLVPRRKPVFVVMDVTVPSLDAWPVRRALAACPGTGILRCVPLPHDHLVHLELHLPQDAVADVMHCLIACVPCGQIGRICSWDEHLSHHGLTHGH